VFNKFVKEMANRSAVERFTTGEQW